MESSRQTTSDTGTCCKKPLTLPRTKRPSEPVAYSKQELLECFPCYYDVTWPLRKFPFLNWLLKYNPRWLLSDFVAGMTVGLMVVPQALAYASIADLPHRYGLYSAFMGCFVYVFFGTSKDVTLGPTAILSLLTQSSTAGCGSVEQRITCAATLTFLSGAIQFAVGLLNLGFLVDFIPIPVISGFTSAAALTIAIGQVKSLLGLRNVGRPVAKAIYDIFANIATTKIWDLVIGVCCMVLVILLKLFKTHVENLEKRRGKELHWVQKIALKFLWLLCTARNAIVVIVAATVGYSLTLQPWFSEDIVSLIQKESTSPPNFTVPEATPEICATLGLSIVVVPLISFLESIAIVKAFAKKNEYRIDSSQELVAIGLSNLMSSFVGSYPVTGSFSRTAVNAQSGVKTPAAGIVTGLIVILALAFLSPVFHFIPASSLSAIIIVAVLPVVDVFIVWKIVKLKYIDGVPLVVSFVLTLFLGIQYGVLIAAGVFMLMLLYRHARPRHEILLRGSTVCVIFNGGWTYPGADYISRRINAEVTLNRDDPERQRTRSVLLDCTAMPEIDFSVVQELREICADFMKEKINVSIVSPQPQVRHILDKALIANLSIFSSMESVLEGNRETEISGESQPLLGGSLLSNHGINVDAKA